MASSDPHILKFVAPDVQEPALCPHWRFIGQCRAFDSAILDGGEIVAGCPHGRGEFLAKGEDARLEGLESDFAVAEIFEPDAIEIRLADIDRKILAPIIRNAIESDVMAGIERADLIGA